VQNDLISIGIFEDPAVDLEILKDNQCFDGAKLQSFERILNAVADPTSILANLVEVLANQLLLLNELDVAQCLC